jgi:hypothetical protein
MDAGETRLRAMVNDGHHAGGRALLREDVALVSASWRRDVPANAAGPTLPPGSGELTFVATRGAEGWPFASAQDTQATALPGAPPKS